MSDSPPIPIIPLTSPNLPTLILSAARRPGFFYVSSHSLDASLLDRVFKTSESFFLDESDEAMNEKERSIDRENNIGWTRIQNERLDLTSSTSASAGATVSDADLKESFYLAPSLPTSPSHPPPVQTLPKALKRSEEDIQELQKECRRICREVLGAFEAGLGLPEGTFVNSHHHAHDRLRLIHYPPTPVVVSGATSSRVGGEKRLAIRAGSHSDYGSITLLFQRDVGGLQVLFEDGSEGDGGSEKDREPGSKAPTEEQGRADAKAKGKWVDIPPIEGCIVVNVGDAMEFWTAGHLSSTQHRVVLPRKESEAGSRFSIAYFHQPDEEASLSPLFFSSSPSDTATATDDTDTRDPGAFSSDSERRRLATTETEAARSRFERVARSKGVQDVSKPLTGGQHLRARLKATYG